MGQVPDAALLGTKLTPLGAERAGNADGSIPPWTGGMTGPALAPDVPVVHKIFADERPLYEVNQGNLAQYAPLLSDGVRHMVTRFAMSLRVYETHRSAAAPQYVYDNTRRNVARAQFDPHGARFGFFGAVGGAPFPIIDTSDPLKGGAQLIWNHLTAWNGASTWTDFVPHYVMKGGRLTLASGGKLRCFYPYYQPDVMPENYGGYYSQVHADHSVPASQGAEWLVWHSSNMRVRPDITWWLLGDTPMRKEPFAVFDAPNPAVNGIANFDESAVFSGDPSQYDWHYVGKKEMLVPYNCNNMRWANTRELAQRYFPNPDFVRWEKHRAWVVDAVLHPGEHNVNARRRLYIDEDTWQALLGEAYDANGEMVKIYAMYNACVPSLPGTIRQADVVFNLAAGAYALSGAGTYSSFSADMFAGPQKPGLFDPQVQVASPCF